MDSFRKNDFAVYHKKESYHPCVILKKIKYYSKFYYIILTFGKTSKQKKVKSEYVIKFDRKKLPKEVIESTEFKMAYEQYLEDELSKVNIIKINEPSYVQYIIKDKYLDQEHVFEYVSFLNEISQRILEKNENISEVDINSIEYIARDFLYNRQFNSDFINLSRIDISFLNILNKIKIQNPTYFELISIIQRLLQKLTASK